MNTSNSKQKDTKEVKKRISIKTMINFLIEFCQNYPELWFESTKTQGKENYLRKINDIDKRNEASEQLKLAQKYYGYIRNRLSNCKLKGQQKPISDEDFKRLREAGVGRVFGYKEEIEELAEKYKKVGLSEDELKIESNIKNNKEKWKRRFYELDIKYGGLDKFRKVFIDSLIKGYYISLPEGMNQILITKFDLNSSNLISEEDEYNKLYDRIYGDNRSILIFDNLLTKRFLDNPDKKKINQFKYLKRYFGIDYKSCKIEGIAQKEGVTQQDISEKIRSACKETVENMNYINILNRARKKIITEYFKHHDIFVDDNKLDENIRKSLLDIISLELLKTDIKRINPHAELKESDYHRLLELLNRKIMPSEYSYYAQIPEKDRYNLISIEASIYAQDIYKELKSNKMELKEIPINYLRLSLETIKMLKKNKIDTLAKLVEKTETEFIAITGIGRGKTLQIIKQRLNELGLQFKGNSEEKQKNTIIVDPKLLYPIEKLKLDKKIILALLKGGFEIVADLVDKERHELQVTGIGKDRYAEIRKFLKKLMEPSEDEKLQFAIETLVETYNKAQKKDQKIKELVRKVSAELEEIEHVMEEEHITDSSNDSERKKMKKKIMELLNELNIQVRQKGKSIEKGALELE